MKKYLKIHIGNYNNPTRDTRELLAAKEVGYDIHILSRDIKQLQEKTGTSQVENEYGFNHQLIHFKWTPLFWIPFFGTQIKYFLWAREASKLKADAISGHDIYALWIAYLSTLFMKKSERPALIYDSHEFEIGRSSKRSKFIQFSIIHLEKFLTKRCKINIMVNDSIANEVQKVHNLKEKPLVVRSIPNYWEIDEEIIKTRREEILNKLNADENTFLCIYHGGIITHRGIEQAIEAISKDDTMCFVLMGYALKDEYLKSILDLVKEHNLEDRFLLLPKMPANRIWEYTGACDVGVMPIQLTVKNHEYSLPNKFFETIQSGTPILSANIVETRKLIEKYDIGMVCDSHDINDIYSKLCEMRDNKEKYKEYKENLKIAKKELCWENEKQIFIDAFSELIKPQ